MLSWVDWGATGSWFQGVSGLAQAAAVVIVGKMALLGWRQEKLGERRIETAELVLTTAYRAREALGNARHHFIFPGELIAAEQKLQGLDTTEMPAGRFERIRHAQVYHSRLAQHEAAWIALLDAMPRARAFFPATVPESLFKLLAQRNAVSMAADFYVDDDGSDAANTIYIRTALCRDLQGHPNVVDNAIKDAMDQLEAVLLPELSASAMKKPVNWRGWLIGKKA